MTNLQSKAYELLKTVPKGRVTTYKALAEAIGSKAYRAVGQYMRHNPYAPHVPCHRVVASNGTIGGFKGSKNGAHITQKKSLLTKEGIEINGNRIEHFASVLFTFNN